MATIFVKFYINVVQGASNVPIKRSKKLCIGFTDAA